MISDRNLVIGSTAQLSNYFPDTFVRVSSRSDLKSYTNTIWDTVYVCFGENRTYLAHSSDQSIRDQFYDVNHSLTVDVVKMFSSVARRVVVYSTAELWNDCSGPVGIVTPVQYKPNRSRRKRWHFRYPWNSQSRRGNRLPS